MDEDEALRSAHGPHTMNDVRRVDVGLYRTLHSMDEGRGKVEAGRCQGRWTRLTGDSRWWEEGEDSAGGGDGSFLFGIGRGSVVSWR